MTPDRPTYSWRDKARFIRTCQCCDHKQEAKDPATYKSDSWKDLKCRKCKDDTFDYGSWRHDDDCQCWYCLNDE